jgi:hypothetical protein
MFVANNAFALLNNMKAVGGYHEKPSPERISNYRFNRTHRIVENLFGLPSVAFRVF